MHAGIILIVVHNPLFTRNVASGSYDTVDVSLLNSTAVFRGVVAGYRGYVQL